MSAILNLFYLYDPWLFHFLRMAFLAGGISLLMLIYKGYKQPLKREIRLPIDSLIAIIGLIIVSALPMLLHQTYDFSVTIMYVKTLLLFLLGIGLFHYLYYPNNQQLFLRDLKIGILIQFSIGLLALFGVSFIIDFALSTNVVLPRFYGSEQEYRLYNITSSAFFQLSLFYIFLLHFILAYNEKHNNIHSIFIFLILCIGLISGRSFLILSLISVILYFKWRYVPILLLFVVICLFLATQFTEHKYVEHALEPLINLIYGKGSVSSSTDTLVQKHLFIPTIKQILIGDGYYFTVQGGYYGGTDSGFLRQLLYGGIGYLMACAIFTFYFIYRLAQNWFDGSWKFILSTFALFTILNIKADTYAFPGIMLVLLMFLSLFGRNGKYILLFQSQGHK